MYFGAQIIVRETQIVIISFKSSATAIWNKSRFQRMRQTFFSDIFDFRRIFLISQKLSWKHFNFFCVGPNTPAPWRRWRAWAKAIKRRLQRPTLLLHVKRQFCRRVVAWLISELGSLRFWLFIWSFGVFACHGFRKFQELSSLDPVSALNQLSQWAGVQGPSYVELPLLASPGDSRGIFHIECSIDLPAGMLSWVIQKLSVRWDNV